MPATPWSSSNSTYSSSVTPPGDWVHSTGVYPGWPARRSMTCANAGKIGFSSSGHDQPDQPGAALAQPARPFVAEHVEGGQHRLPGTVADAGLVVEDPADGRLADAGLGRDLRQGCHVRM